MNRKEFLSLIGWGAAAAVCGGCLGGCNKEDSGFNPPPVDFTLDLSNPAYAALKNVGGTVYYTPTIVANTPAGYVAVNSSCTHQGGTLAYDLATNQFACPVHGSRFTVGGAVVNGPAASPLETYKTTLTGNSLRVSS